MTKAVKKIQRKIKKNKKKQEEKELKEKVNMFSELGDHCLICEKPFDKQNKEMVLAWYVVIREKQNNVNLYCPECWTRANNFIDQLREGVNAQ